MFSDIVSDCAFSVRLQPMAVRKGNVLQGLNVPFAHSLRSHAFRRRSLASLGT